MMLVDQMGRVTASQLSAHRSIRRPHHRRTQPVFFCAISFVDFELDKETDLRVSNATVDFPLPCRFVKKDIFTEVFGIDEAKVTLRPHVFDFTQAFTLNVKRLFGAIGMTLQGKVAC